MSFVVETGGGTPNATAYADPTFVTAYLTDQGRETENSWSTIATALQQEACMVATRYLDSRWGGAFKGVRYRSLISGRKATGTILFGALPGDTETVTIGQKTYRFVDTLAQENDVLRGGSAATAATNLVAAINGSDDGTNVDEDTLPNYEATAAVSTATVTVTAMVKGTNGNLVALSSTVTGATVSGSGYLAGGLDEGPQPLEFPRSGCTDFDGREITGVPLRVKQAMAEYAVRAAASATALDADPTVSTGPITTRSRKAIGPLEKDESYQSGGAVRIYKPFPAADRLLTPLLRAASAGR